MKCPRCATALEGKPNYCGQCGFVLAVVHYDSDAQTAGRVPCCPRCGQLVRAGNYPHRTPGWISPEPWNAGWRGSCEQCGFQFSVSHSQDSQNSDEFPIPLPGRGVRRRIVVRPASQAYFQDVDLQLHLAGVEIEVESDSYGGYNVSEHYFLTKEEAAWLVRALGGSLAICYEQYHWDVDVT